MFRYMEYSSTALENHAPSISWYHSDRWVLVQAFLQLIFHPGELMKQNNKITFSLPSASGKVVPVSPGPVLLSSPRLGFSFLICKLVLKLDQIPGPFHAAYLLFSVWQFRASCLGHARALACVGRSYMWSRKCED